GNVAAPVLRKHRPENRDADERNDARTELADLDVKPGPAAHVFIRQERIDAGRRTRNDVGDSKTPLRQAIVIHEGDALGNETGVVEQLPEPVRKAREVMSRQRSPDSRIDADTQHLNI